MDKSCANHPESMALATCKACEKSVCLMCVVDEKEGTFCSSACHSAFVAGEEVPKFVAAEPVTAAAPNAGVQKIDSIFDDAGSSAPAMESAPASEESMPIVAEGTKWRSIGGQCELHPDTPAVATCDTCGKRVCALCLLEAAQGTFCSNECLSVGKKQPAAQAAPAERAALAGKPVFRFREPPKEAKGLKSVAVVLLILCMAAGAYYGYKVFFEADAPVTPVVTNPETTTPTTTTPVTTTPVTTTPVTTTPVVKNPVTTTPVVKNPVTTTPVTTTPVTTTTTPRKQPPKPERPMPMRLLNPWSAEEPGAWYRIRTQRGSQVSYTDIGLKSRAQDSYVLVSQTCTNGQASTPTETRKEPTAVYLRGEETFNFDGRGYLCEIRANGREDDAPRTWALLAGKNMGAVFKSTAPDGTITARRAWEHTLRVNNRPFECLVVEAEVKKGNTTRTVKSWYSSLVPMGLVHQEQEGELISLIDLGDDWAKRPAFPK